MCVRYGAASGARNGFSTFFSDTFFVESGRCLALHRPNYDGGAWTKANGLVIGLLSHALDIAFGLIHVQKNGGFINFQTHPIPILTQNLRT